MTRFHFESEYTIALSFFIHSLKKVSKRKMTSLLPCCLSTAVGIFLGLIGVTYVLRQLYFRKCKSKVRLDGKIVIVTGANTGIGLSTAIDLARRGATIIMACRDMRKGEKALDKVKLESSSEDILLMHLDLSSLDSVRDFAKEFLSKYSKLNILINNAGVMSCPYMKTKDGFEMQIGINHFGHFALTNLLLKALANGAPARVVTVSSIGHWLYGKMDFEDINYEKRSYDKMGAYGQSKLANVLFTRELHNKAKEHDITTYSLHPGFVVTELARYDTYYILFFRTMGALYGRTPEQGAQTTIYCAVEEGLEKHSGGYFSNCTLSTYSTDGQNDGYAKKLWELSEQITGTEFPL